MSVILRITDCRVLIVDDALANLDLLGRLVEGRGVGDITVTTDGANAVELCRKQPPDLMLLDLHMPGIDGLGVLAGIAGLRAGAGHFPVLVLTGDDTATARRGALAAGADDFLSKPFDAIEVGLRVDHMLRSHIMHRLLSDEGEHLRLMVAEQTNEIELTRAELLDRLAIASEFRDDDTHQHAGRIGRTARILAEGMRLETMWSEQLERAASLHDIGKLGIPDAILLKPGRLTEDEHEAMKRHTAIGARILGGSRTELLQLAEEVALSHHERWDGSGYPAGLVGTQTPRSGRIVAIADVFDALTHERPYKEAWSAEDARQWILDHDGTLFDPAVVAAFSQTADDMLLAPVG